MRVVIFVEGGGGRRALQQPCREAFREFFQKVIGEGYPPKIVAGGSREHTFDDFKIALKDESYKDSFLILLVDSEAPIERTDPKNPESEEVSNWTHLKRQDKWKQPRGTSEDNVHLMVQCMEAWFLSDKPSLKRFYGNKFKADVWPDLTDVEPSAKDYVYSVLAQATKETDKPYNDSRKRSDGFRILGLIDPVKVREVSRHADRLCIVVVEKTRD